MPELLMLRKINVGDALDSFEEAWSPKIIGDVNGQDVRIAKLRGAFIWHAHTDTDELFLVMRGALRMELRQQPDIELSEGDMLIVPRGVEHRPVADQEAQCLLVTLAGAVNTGDAPENERTRHTLDRL